MIRFQTHPVFCSLALIAAAVIAVEGVVLGTQHAAAVKTVSKLRSLEQEHQALTGANPFPYAANAAKIAAELAWCEQEISARRDEWLGKPGEPGPLAKLPASSTDAYFDLAAFIEGTREKAQAAGVALGPDERFAFSAYAHQGPPVDLIATVFGERQIIQGLVSALIGSGPKRLLSVERELPRNAAQGKENGAGGGPDSDLFAPDSRLTVREPGRVKTTAFRLRFTGQTAVLRALLNKLAELDRCLIVCGIEVEPTVEGVDESQTIAPAAGAPVPVVAQNLSRFTVMVEHVELEDASVPAS